VKTLIDALRLRDFAITAELALSPNTDADDLLKQAHILNSGVDAIQVTENQYGCIHMSPLAAASILKNANLDPVLQLSCCNRNRAALIADLLGARALGITSLLLVQGKKMPESYQPQPVQVADIGVDELIATAGLIKEDPKLKDRRHFLIGAVAKAHSPKPDWVASRLVSKINAGAQFMQTQLCFDLDVLRSFVAHLQSLKLLHRCYIIADIAILPSAEYARWLRINLRHIMIPGKIIRRLEQARDAELEGVKICSEYLREIAAIPGVSGVNIIASGEPESIVAAIKAAGLQGD